MYNVFTQPAVDWYVIMQNITAKVITSFLSFIFSLLVRILVFKYCILLEDIRPLE